MTDNKKYKELEKEFDKFVYITSHDLRAPLRQINSFMTLFFDSLKTEMNDEQILFKNMMLECVNDAESIIHALLQYSRTKYDPDNITSFNISDAYDAAIEKLSNKIGKKNALIDMDCEDIKIQADFNHITQIFYHLIDNSIKFNRDSVPPKINIRITSEEDYVLIRVKDNGIGFPLDQMEHASTILKQLHPKNQYEGDGLGLALIKKIVSFYDGSVEALDTQNEGTNILVKIKSRT